MSKRFLLCVAVGLAVSGCAVTRDQPGAPSGAGSCNGPTCFVNVTVTDCRITSVIYDPLHVYGKNVNIHWNIDPESVEYVFAETDGIVIKNNDGEFDTPRRTAGGKKFIWHDKNDKQGNPERSYAYGITVMRGSQRCPTLDPQIVNH